MTIVKEFIDFINKQPAGRKLDHDTWHSCAVGEFAEATESFDVTNLKDDLYEAESKLLGISECELEAGNGEHVSLMETLNVAGNIQDGLVKCKYKLNTYSSLQKFVKSLPHLKGL